jgi:hypothetical protein
MPDPSYTQYYEVITNDSTAVAPGAAVSFSLDGNRAVTGNPLPTPTRFSNTTFLIGTVGGDTFWRVTWQVGVANSGQLQVGYILNSGIGVPTLLPETVIGSSWGHGQLTGDFILKVPYLQRWYVGIYNPAANQSSLNLLSHGVGNVHVVASIVFTCLGT